VENLRICYVAADVAIPHFRGSSTHVYEIAKNLVRKGNEVHVVARRVTPGQLKEETIDGMKIHRFYRGVFFSSKRSSFVDSNALGSYRGSPPGIIWKSYELYLRTAFPTYIAVQVARLVRDYSIDLLFERETSFGAGAMASILTGRPCVLEVIGNRVTGLQLRTSRRIVTYSHSFLEDAVEKSKIVQVTAAVDTDLFRPDPQAGAEVRRAYALGSAPLVGYVGTFQEWHGMDELIEAAKSIIREKPEAKFLMVGPYYRATMQKCSDAGLDSPFVFTGPIPYERVPGYMNACDVLVAPYNPSKIHSSEQVRSRGLGSPLKVFEYMAVGKPTITTNVKPISDPIEDGVTGMLVEQGDSTDLCAKILRLLDDKGAAEAMGRAGRASVVAKYSWNLVTNDLLRVFQTALNA
jgi:glycosyltransferase involved in cell wall biosynthesis